MHRGKVVESGTPSQIFGRPANDYTRELVAAIPLLRAKAAHRVFLLSRSDRRTAPDLVRFAVGSV